MSSAQRVAKNILILIVSSIINLVLGFFYAGYASRYLGAEGYGIIGYSLGLTSIFGSVMEMGLSQLAVREISKDHWLLDKYVLNMVAIKAILVPITLIPIALTANILSKGSSTSVTVVYILALATGLTTFSNIFNVAFQSFEKMKYSSLSTIINGAVMLAGAILAIHLHLDVVGFADVYLLTSAVVFTFNLAIYALKFFGSRASLNPGWWGYVMRESLPFGLAAIFVSIFARISSVMLRYIMGDEVAGWYYASYGLIMTVAIIPSVVNTSLFPVMCRFYSTSRQMLHFTQQRSFRYMTLLGLPIGVGTTLIADKLILLIFPQTYANSVIVLQILIWSSVLAFSSSNFNRVLSTSNHQMTVTKLMAISAGVNILLNLLLIPRFSYIGAALAMVAAEFMSLILSACAASRIGFSLSGDDLKFLAKIIMANAVMAAFILPMRGTSVFIIIPSAATVYFAASYFLFKAFDKDDAKLFRSIVKGV
jgi:O-antigen/teichoic acid export membrane protein